MSVEVGSVSDLKRSVSPHVAIQFIFVSLLSSLMKVWRVEMISSHIGARKFSSVPELIAFHAGECPAKRAFVHGDKEICYEDLYEITLQISHALKCAGATLGSPVVIIANTSISTVLALLGGMMAGCAIVPISTSFSPEKIKHIVESLYEPIVFVESRTRKNLQLSLGQVIELECLERWANTWAEDLDFWPPRIKKDDYFRVIFPPDIHKVSSPVIQSHGEIWGEIARYSIGGFDAAVTVLVTPFYLGATLVSLLTTLAYGGTVVLMERFDARNFLKESQRARATHTVLRPFEYQKVMEVHDFDDFDLNSFCHKAYTGGEFSAPLKADVVRRWPGVLISL